MHFGPVLPLALPCRAETDDEQLALDHLNAILCRTVPTLREISTAVCDYYLISSAEWLAHTRHVLPTHARHVFCFFAFRYTRASLRQIGMRIGNLDHTTVHCAVRKIERLALSQPMVRDDLDRLRLQIAEKILHRPHTSEPAHVAETRCH